MPSKLVVAHQKLSAEIAAAYQTHGKAISDSVHAVMLAAEPPAKVNLKPLLDYTLAVSESALARLTEADDEHQKELGDDAAPRGARDEAAKALKAEIVRFKGATEQLFGASWVSKLTFPKVVPGDPAHIKRTAEQVLSALDTHTLPLPSTPGVGRVDVSEWKAAIGAPLAALTEALDQVKREENEATATLEARDAALDALVTANVNAAQLAQVLARIGKVSHLVVGLRGTLVTNLPRAGEEVDVPTDAPVTPPVG